MAAKTITLTATAPDGRPVSVNVGAKRVVGAIRITLLQGVWVETVHKTLPNAITGPNQTPAWNSAPRYAMEVVDGATTGPWLGASK